MDLELFSKLVLSLLETHDVVGLPGMGSFVTELTPASFSDRGFTINPPYRRLVLRPGECTDKSLVLLYSESCSIDERSALNIVQKFLTDLAVQVKDRKSVEIPSLGRLRATMDNTLFFISDPELNIFPAGFGLEPVSLRAHQSRLIDILADVEEDFTPATPAAPQEQQPSEAEEQPSEPSEAEEQPAAEQAAKPLSEDLEQPAQSAEASEQGAKYLFARIVLVLLIIALVLAGAFMLAARLYPDFIDSLLYTQQELDIINYRIQ